MILFLLATSLLVTCGGMWTLVKPDPVCVAVNGFRDLSNKPIFSRSSHKSADTDKNYHGDIRFPFFLALSHPQFLTHQTVVNTLYRRHAGRNDCTFCNQAMDLLRNGIATAVDYIERPLFYILRMSDFCYLHPSTPAR